MFRNPVTDLVLALVVVLLIFGPKRLPALGKSLGHGIREFKDGITGKSTVEDEDRPALNAAQESPPAPSAAERESAEVGSTEQRA